MYGQNKKVASRETRGARASRSRHSGHSRLASRASRRGVLLLVVLSMLVLFLMIGTAYIIVAKQSQQAAKNQTKANTNATNQAALGNLLDEVLLQLVRDTDNPASSLRYHSLLGDLYGNDGFKATIAPIGAQGPKWGLYPGDPNIDPMTGEFATGGGTVPPGGMTGGQLVQFEVNMGYVFNSSIPNSAVVDLYDMPIFLSKVDNAYSGQLLTFLSGPAKGVSTRIVGYRPRPNNGGLFTVMNFPLADGTLLDDPNKTGDGPQLLAGHTFLVNGRPGNGTGVGYNTTTANLAPPPAGTAPPPLLNLFQILPDTTKREVALLPNAQYFTAEDVVPLVTSALADRDPTLLLTASQRAYIASLPPGNNPGQQTFEAVKLAKLVGLPGFGGQDESYDAPDFQNFSLAFMQDEPEDRTRPQQPPPPTGLADPPSLDEMVLPSFHRPELVNYWKLTLNAAGANLAADPDLLRRVMARPSWFDHPNFTGSNPNLAPLLATFRQAYVAANGDLANANVVTASERMLDTLQRDNVILGPWDVDNDNDGNRDSVWVDFGAPVVTGPNGRRVKPLAAILMIDLDGRVNLNTASTLDLENVDRTPNDGVANGMRDSLQGANLAQSQSSLDVPRGIGWGPAEVSIASIVGPGSAASVFRGVTNNGRLTVGRYGADMLPGSANNYDQQAEVTFFGWPKWGRQAARSLFASPPDLRARYGNGLTAYGQPLFSATLATEAAGNSNNEGRLLYDSPYESALFAEGVDTINSPDAADAPFSFGELEKFLRVFDADSPALPGRLAILTGSPNPAERNRLTVESWNVPAPAIVMPPHLRPFLSTSASSRPPRTAAELLEVRMRRVLFGNDPAKLFPEQLDGDPDDPATDAGRLRQAMRKVLAPELAAGVKLNLNRPFGNGRDDSNPGDPGYRVVDEPGEDPQLMWRKNPATPIPNGVTEDPVAQSFNDAVFTPLDVNEDGTIDQLDSALQRQLLARHLYVTALLESAPVDFGTTPNTNPAPEPDRLLAARIAQWAVNAVDFRDSDSIMTAFEYDLNPFDGWDTDGDPSTAGDQNGTDKQSNPASANTMRDDTVVWGVERPELLINETFAWHDRNTTDEAGADTPEENEDYTTTFETLPDMDFDQKYRPRGAFFLELYNPWPANPAVSEDLHRLDNDGNDLGVDLARVVQRGTPNESPVWRVTVHEFEQDKPMADPDDPDPNNRPTKTPDRSIYFGGSDPAELNNNWDNDGVAFYNNASDNTLEVQPVRPGRYMVVGSGTRVTRNGEQVYFSPLGQVWFRGPVVPLAQRPPLRGVELRAGQHLTPPNVSTVRLVDHMAAEPDDAGKLGAPAGGGGPTLSVPMQAPSEREANNPQISLPALPVAQPPAAVAEIDKYVADVAIIDRVATSANPRRLTLSEPRNGYPRQIGNLAFVPMHRPDGTRAPRIPDEIYDPNEEGYYAMGSGPPGPNGPEGIPEQPMPTDVPLDDGPGGDPALREIGTKYNYRHVFLQRLANPLLPFHPQTNPYRTVDRASVNISVFNGRLIDGQRENGLLNTAVRRGFSSRERGYSPDEGQRQFNLWATQPQDDKAIVDGQTRRGASQRTGPDFAAPYSMDHVPRATLGFLNWEASDTTLPANGPAALTVQKRLRPESPFPWFAWNNRPYASGNELLLVPYLRSSELLSNFAMFDEKASKEAHQQANDPLVFTETGPQTRRQDPEQPITLNNRGPFQHLENFRFNDPPLPASEFRIQPSQLYRLLDLVGTPSLYSAASTWLNPTRFAASTTGTNALPQTMTFEHPMYNRQAPFDTVSTFREPGKINLNTISSSAVYGALFHSKDNGNDVRPEGNDNANASVHPGPLWAESGALSDAFTRSRRGYGEDGQGLDMLAMDLGNPNAGPAPGRLPMPTLFANPFRGAAAGSLVPLQQMVRADVETTILRSTSATPGAIDDHPLFAARTGQLGEASGLGANTQAYRDAQRNAFYRYAPITRLQNLVGTQSNVYAVWITIGFFEVDEVRDAAADGVSAAVLRKFNNATTVKDARTYSPLFDRIYPDGYMLGKEAGLDEGNVRRLRGFYIIDRSRPTVFQPGRDLGVENVIRLRRRIE